MAERSSCSDPDALERTCNETFAELGVICPICLDPAATVTFMTWRPPGAFSASTAEQTVIKFSCAGGCWRSWGPNNEAIAREFDYSG